MAQESQSLQFSSPASSTSTDVHHLPVSVAPSPSQRFDAATQLRALATKPRYQPLLARIFFETTEAEDTFLGISIGKKLEYSKHQKSFMTLDATAPIQKKSLSPLQQLILQHRDFTEDDAVRIFDLLITAGANIHLTDAKGKTPLHDAAAAGHLTFVERLVAKGADLNATTTRGKTALMIASSKKHRAIIEFLSTATTPAIADHADTAPATATTLTDFLDVLASVNPEQRVEKALAFLLQLAQNPRYFMLLSPIFYETIEEEQQETLIGFIPTGKTTSIRAQRRTLPAVNALNKERETPLKQLLLSDFGRAFDGNEKIALTKILRAAGAEGACLHVADKFGRTPLDIAVQHQTLPLLQALIEATADINAADRFGATPLYKAIVKESLSVVRALIDAGANVNAICYGNYTPLHIAQLRRHLPIVQMLIAAGANVNTIGINAEGNTPLHQAITNGDLPIVQVLIAAGADINAIHTSYGGRTPLHRAVALAKLQIAQVLITAGANINATSEDGQTPLHLAASKGPVLLDIVQALINAGADLSIRTNNRLNGQRRTPAEIAEFYGHVTIAKLLRDAYSQPRATTPTCSSSSATETPYATLAATPLENPISDDEKHRQQELLKTDLQNIISRVMQLENNAAAKQTIAQLSTTFFSQYIDIEKYLRIQTSFAATQNPLLERFAACLRQSEKTASSDDQRIRLAFRQIAEFFHLQPEANSILPSMPSSSTTVPTASSVVVETSTPPSPSRTSSTSPVAPVSHQMQDISASMYCPITQELMTDPVIATDGHSYERQAIQTWFQKSTRSPITNLKLDPLVLIPNIALRNTIIAHEESLKTRSIPLADHSAQIATTLGTFATSASASSTGNATSEQTSSLEKKPPLPARRGSF